MRRYEFGVYMKNVKMMKESNIGQWISYGIFIENYFNCDLDNEYEKDELSTIENKAGSVKIKQKPVIKHYKDFCNQFKEDSSTIQNNTNRNFWDITHINQGDEINKDIWNNSPQCQCLIDLPNRLSESGDTGAQQAMIEEFHQCRGIKKILPWVPDLIGKNCHEENSIIVIGLSYSGFIKEYSTRKKTIEIEDYNSSSNWMIFLERFIANVVRDDGNYYKKIENLVSIIPGIIDQSFLCIFDLCRASIVRRGQYIDGMKREDDTKSSNYTGKYHGFLKKYLVHNNSWTTQRINRCKSKIILTLGEDASVEFAKQFGISFKGLNHKHSIQYIFGNERIWIPIYHPSAINVHDINYGIAKKLLEKNF